MKIDCNIDGKVLTLSLNSNKPLSLILQENLGQSVDHHCKGKLCGLCAVLVDNKAQLSCLIPAFELRNKEVKTFEFFQKSREMRDIAKAYELIGSEPCPECYASRTIVLESLVSSGENRPDEIKRMLSAIRCSCMEEDDEVAIVQKANELRKKRNNNVRRS